MAEIDGGEGVELLLRLVLSDGSSAGYRLAPRWELSSPDPTAGAGGMAVASEDATATASLPEIVNPDRVLTSGEPNLEVVKMVLSMTRHGECVASFPLVRAINREDSGDLPPVYSQISLKVDTSEGCMITRVYECQGSQRKWISIGVYSLSMIPEEEFRSLEQLLGSKVLVFLYQGSLDVQCPPLRLNFKKNFQCDKQLGEGTEGVVYKCSSTFSPHSCAIKKVIMEDLYVRPEKGEPSEVNLLAMLSHRNIAQLYFAWTEKEKTRYGESKNVTFVCMELCVTSLMHYLKEMPEVDRDTATHIIRQIIAGLKYMHQKDVVHRDIKPANILLTEDLTIKIADLGIAKRKKPNVPNFNFGNYGSTPYRAPEIINMYERHDEKVDVFPAGMIYFELHMPGVRQRKDKVRKLSKLIREGMQEFDQLGLPFNLDSLLAGTDILTGWKGEYNILKKMLLPNHRERPSAREVMAMLDASSDGNPGELQKGA